MRVLKGRIPKKWVKCILFENRLKTNEQNIFDVLGLDEKALLKGALCVRVDVASIELKKLQFDRAIEKSHDHGILTRI